MRFEYEKPGNFTIFLDDVDVFILSGSGSQEIMDVRGGLKGPDETKVSIVVDERDLDRVEFNARLDMAVYLSSVDLLPVAIDRVMLDPFGDIENRQEVLSNYFGPVGTVIVVSDVKLTT